ncbi:hypothetical protein D3C71_1394950 [compost metagenome]
MHDQSRYGDRPQVIGEVGFGEGLDALIVGICRAGHALPPPVLDHARRNSRTRAVEAVERATGNIQIKLRPVGRQLLAHVIEHLDWKTARVCRALDHDRRYRTNQNQLGHALVQLTMPGDIARRLPAAGRVADMHGVAQVQLLYQRGDVRRVVVHVVAIAYLRRAAVAAPIVCNDAIALANEEQRLAVPIVTAERPPMVEHDGLGVLRAPVLVEDFNTILGCHFAHGHVSAMGVRRVEGRECKAGCRGQGNEGRGTQAEHQKIPSVRADKP